MSEESIMPPDLDDVLEELKHEIFANMNCIQVARVESYDLATRTVSAQIQVQRRLRNGRTIKYPLLVDCPTIALQGGGSYIDMPISVGDYCLILFSDRDIDNWWSAAQLTAPNTKRKHSLSDGFALVGVNPKTDVPAAKSQTLRLQSDFPIEINGPSIALNGDGKRLVTYGELNTALQAMVTLINSQFATKLDGGGAPGTVTLDISSAETSTVRTGG